MIVGTYYPHIQENETCSLGSLCLTTRFFHKKMSLKNPKTLRKSKENLQPQMSELQFLKTLIFPRAL